MTLSNFLEELASVIGDAEPHVDKFGRIRIADPDAENATDCPVTWVAWNLNGCEHGACYIAPAVMDLGLDVRLGLQLMDACDNGAHHNSTLRQQLLHACGLGGALAGPRGRLPK